MKRILLILSATLLHSALIAQIFRLQENFNAAALPMGWTNTAVTGTQTWSFGINGSTANAGNNNLDGTAMAFFDDDNLGASSTNNTVTLTSPIFDNSNDISSTLEFDYNFREFAGPADRFYVEVYDGTAWNMVFSTTANDCGNWLGACVGNFPHANIDISAHKNVNCQVRFTYHDGNDWCWYVGIDNVRVTSSVNNDLEVASIENPKNSCSLSAAETTQVLIKNVGGNNISSPFSITIDVDNGNQTFTDTVNSTINSGDSLLYTFNGTINLSNKAVYSLKAYSSFSLDSIYTNDTITTTVENITALNIPFIEDFESVSSNWIISGQNSSWQIGTPNGTVLDSAYRGTGSAVTNLSGNYNNSETSYLETACISTSQPNRVPVLSFYLNYLSESGFDELILESSIDNGATWQKVNAGGLSSNWYPNGTSWDGFSNGWIQVETSLDSLVGQVDFKLRFTFTSDGSGNREGFAIDDFEINYQNSTDLKIDAIAYPSAASQICGLGNEFIRVQLTNIGQTIDSTYLSYRVNGGSIVTELLDSTIRSFQSVNYTFSTPYNFSGRTNHSIDAWLSTRNDQFSANDSIINQQITNFGLSIGIDTLPFYENFDDPIWNVSSGNLNLASNWSRTTTSSLISNTWTVNSFQTSSTSTGPSNDYSGGGNYLYTEASGASSGDLTFLISPCIRISGSIRPRLTFYTHGYGSLIPDLRIEVNSGAGWQRIATFNNNTQTSIFSPWTERSVDLTPFANSTIKIRFNAVYKGSWQGDLAIDEIKIEEYYPYDLSLEKIISPSTLSCPLGANESISIELKNKGYTLIPSGAPVNFTFNGTTFNDSITIPIGVDSTVVFTFNQTVNLSNLGSTNHLKAYTSLSLDSNYLNDTISQTITNQSRNVNYIEDFELFVDGSCAGTTDANANDILQGWTETSLQTYRWHMQDVDSCNGGTPTANTGPRFDHTIGNGKFLYTEFGFGVIRGQGEATVETPCIDFEQEMAAEMSFWYHKYGGDMSDLYIDVYSNSGWVLAFDSIIGSTHSSATANWLQKITNLTQFAGQSIKVRFRATEPNNPASDMAIDDVHFYNPLTVGTVEIQKKPNFNLYPNPNNGNFNLNVSNELVGKQYQVFDLKGGLVKQGRINTTNSQIELSNADQGFYFMRIEGLAKAERIVVL